VITETTPRAEVMPAASWPARTARMAATAPIVLYQRVLSPAIPRRCKYEPTCSRYAIQAVGRYGILKGLVLAGWRLLRCNPWSHGGYDPVEAQHVFRTGPESGG
jgi:putative membrane protein insertion efficiency factor